MIHFQNGSFLRHFDSKWLSKMEYCMQPTVSETEQVYLMAYNCVIEEPLTMAYSGCSGFHYNPWV